MFWILQISQTEEDERAQRLQRDQQTARRPKKKKTPNPADITKKIPGVGTVTSGFEKMFPILWSLIGFSFRPGVSVLVKILGWIGLLIVIIFIWPLLTTLSFIKIRNLILMKLPETNGIEMVASFLPITIVLFCMLVGSFMLICAPTIQGVVRRFLMELIYDINIDCGF